MATVEEKPRIQSLDSLRGLALLGIFLVNMISFHSPYLYYNPFEWWDAATDFQNYRWIDIFVQASFYPLFAMMFGFGVAMQRESAMGRGMSYTLIGVRRFSFLLFIGVIHAFLIWSGDILINYAVLGFLLLMFLRLSGKTLIIIGSLLLFIPTVFLGVLSLLMAKVDPTGVVLWTDIMGINQSMAAYGSGSFMEITDQRLTDWLVTNGPDSVVFQLITIFPHLLIGAGAQKLNVFSRWSERPKWAMMTFISFFLTGVILKSLPYVVEPNLAYVLIQDFIGGPLLAISYAALVIALGKWKYAEKIGRPFASVGRMSLTNYLLQSVIGTLIFYHYGLGFYGQITLTTGVWLVFAIFAAQVVLSELWLSKLKRGPMESLWRKVTYLTK
ncbi:DUF418 domain-containing protein [Bacillus sp. FJAT-42315]|uniref:DUF418 domain-containing protein n=1 Tax=Bacillus sp. FJAT-42315 TaxID=2014077 RepID=UPI000C233C78|nr:DUF418 domain-containing protein [Bacillus sp. FJAT-42315]